MEIPETVWAEARALSNEWQSGPLGVPVTEVIARAIMAERERCANIAYASGKGRELQKSDAIRHGDKRAARDFETMKFEAIQISQAIRNPLHKHT